MSKHPPVTTRVDWLGLWLLFSAWCPVSGWTLSVVGCLNAAGIILSFALFFVVVFLLWKPLGLAGPAPARRLHLMRSRRLLPRLWLALTLLALIGGLAYVPNNYDYLTYRFPRVLFWCWQHHWFWITTVNERMNYSGSLFEWIMVPSFILFNTDRFFFLVNFVSFLFLPGLIFSFFRGLGLSGRIGWWWMWVLPCGYCYLLQAGSVGNDSFALVYLLAAFHFLFRSRQSASIRNLFFSTLAIALMTNAKLSNLPLALPWAIVLFFERRQVFANATPALIVAILVAAASASFVPQATMNRIYSGDFFGDPGNRGHLKSEDPVGGILGNVLDIGLCNLAPPIWYREITVKLDLPAVIEARIARGFPRLGTSMVLREFPVEEGAGLGLGCVAGAGLFLLVSAWARLAGGTVVIARSPVTWWFIGGVAIACLVYMAKIVSEAAPRLVATYYPFLIAGALMVAALDGRVIRWRLFRVVGVLAMLSALPGLILSPSRPLFPVQAVGALLTGHASASIQQRFHAVYPLYAQRAFAFDQILPLVPAGEARIGFVQNSNALEAALWRPFGTHEVVEVRPSDSPEQIKARGVRWLIVSADALAQDQTTIDALLAKWSAHQTAVRHFAMTVQQGDDTWYLVRLDGP